MAPFYNWLLADQKIPQTALKVEKKTLEKWSELNQRQLEQLQTAVEEAEKNFGETEVAEALLERARFLCLIGDKVLSKCFACKWCFMGIMIVGGGIGCVPCGF